MHAYIFVSMHALVFGHLAACTCVHTCVCMHACVYVHFAIHPPPPQSIDVGLSGYAPPPPTHTHNIEKLPTHMIYIGHVQNGAIFCFNAWTTQRILGGGGGRGGGAELG